MATGLVKVLSHNVNGILNPIKRSKMLSKMKREKVGIVFLQETQLSEPTTLNSRKGGSTIFDLMLTKAQGLTICGGDLNVRLNSNGNGKIIGL